MHTYARTVSAPAAATRSPGQRATRPLNRLTAAFGAVLLASAAALALVGQGASPALAHDELVGSTVETDASDGTAQAVTLHFNNEIIPVGSEILVMGPDGADDSVSDGAPTINGRDVTQALLTPLASGEYRIAWRVVSSDGHPISGELFLTVAADGSAALDTVSSDTPTTDTDDAAHDHDHADHDHDHADHDHSETSVTGEGASPEGTLATPTSETVDDSAATVQIVLGVIAAVVAVGAIVTIAVGARRRRMASGGATTSEQHTAASDNDQHSTTQNSTTQNSEDQK